MKGFDPLRYLDRRLEERRARRREVVIALLTLAGIVVSILGFLWLWGSR